MQTSYIKRLEGKPIIHENHGKSISWDFTYAEGGKNLPVIIFVHGFKGFKDWGHFNLIARRFAEQGFGFLKLNLSHNGTTPEQLMDFADLEAFGNNTFSIELDDIGAMIDHLQSPDFVLADKVDTSRLGIIGHSRGGGLALLKCMEDQRISAVVTWAAIHDLSKRWTPTFIEKWKQDGVQYIHNGRTGQEMPLKYALYEDFLQTMERLNIPKAVKTLKQPLLVCHGTDDETLPYPIAEAIHSWQPASQLKLIEGANHTFGGKHPFADDTLPEASRQVVTESVDFFRQKLA